MLASLLLGTVQQASPPEGTASSGLDPFFTTPASTTTTTTTTTATPSTTTTPTTTTTTLLVGAGDEPVATIAPNADMDHLPCFKDLIAVLFECFIIISLGYLSARFKLISPQAKDLNSYLTTFALPMIIFLNIAQMEIQTISLSFLVCILIAKLLIFLLVSILALAVSYPRNFGYAGSLAILATQSNDFALGYPLIKSLYGETKPEMLNYLSLMAPIQLLILNPLGISMLEYHKSSRVQRKLSKSREALVCGDCAAVRRSADDCGPAGPGQLGQCNDTGQQIRKRSPSSSVSRSRSSSPAPAPTPTMVDSSGPPRLVSTSTASTSSSASLGAASGASHCRRRASISSICAAGELAPPGHRQPRPSTGCDARQATGDQSSCFAAAHVSAGGADHANGQPSHERYPSAAVERVPALAPAQHAHRLGGGAKRKAGSANELGDLVGACPMCASHVSSRAAGHGASMCGAFNFRFLTALATNPLIVASVVALVVNLVHGPELPKFVTRVSNTIAASFAAPALFVVGQSMYGKFELLIQNPNDLLLSSVLVLTKELILPALMRTLAMLVLPGHLPADELPYLIDFSFLYGLLPTAPTACIIAKQYGILPNVVSLSMLLSTFASAPLMLASSAIINPATKIRSTDLDQIASRTVEIGGSLSLGLALLTVYALFKSRNQLPNYNNLIAMPEIAYRRFSKLAASQTRLYLILLAMAQTLIGLGGVIVMLGRPEREAPDDGTSSIPTATTTTSNHAELLVQPDSLELLASVQDGPSHVLHDSLFRLQYALSSLGFLMARFLILCLLINLTSGIYKGQAFVAALSPRLLKAFAAFSLITLLWLAFDSSQLVYAPGEPSLPNHRGSLLVRLVLNLVFLLIAVPLFALLVGQFNRAKNMASRGASSFQHDENSSSSSSDHMQHSLAKSPFQSSRVSLNSDTSSALTSNTNLESTANQRGQTDGTRNCKSQLADHTDHLLPGNDFLSINVGELPHVHRHHQSRTPSILVHHPQRAFVNDPTNNVYQQQQNNQHELGAETSSIGSASKLKPHQFPLDKLEFGKYSILIVYMIIETTLNLMSITQKLLQDETGGTFRQIEIICLATEFGQGLVTFLIYGLHSILFFNV